MTHYGCFCHLAAAHSLLIELRATKDVINGHERHFKHWQIFESAYLHLGAAWQQIIKLWTLIHRQLRELDSTIDDRGALRAYYKENDLSTYEVDNMQKMVIEFRNEIAHYARHATRMIGDSYCIPFEFQKGITWSEQLKAQKWISTDGKLFEDISTLQEVIETTHIHLMKVFSSVLNKHRIKIIQESGQDDEFCEECDWRLETVFVKGKSESAGTDGYRSLSSLENLRTLGSASIGASGVSESISTSFGDMSVSKIKKCVNPDCGYVKMN